MSQISEMEGRVLRGSRRGRTSYQLFPAPGSERCPNIATQMVCMDPRQKWTWFVGGTKFAEALGAQVAESRAESISGRSELHRPALESLFWVQSWRVSDWTGSGG